MWVMEVGASLISHQQYELYMPYCIWLLKCSFYYKME